MDTGEYPLSEVKEYEKEPDLFVPSALGCLVATPTCVADLWVL